jgi:hypothetical protein
MKHAEPRGLSRSRLKWLLSNAKSCDSAGRRIEVLSRLLLGRPYANQPLVGSAIVPERFTVSLDAFDCVTYIETVLALTLASSADEFINWMRLIRYEDGRIAWERRNHYMTGWIRSNVRAGILRRLSFPDACVVTKRRTLDVVSGLRAIHAQFSCIPKSEIFRVGSRLQTGDFVFFASTRNHLDVFHCGLIVRNDDRLAVRHASRSRGAVVEQDLNSFLKANRMAGVIFARPKAAAS